jgi:hypothetical protein
VGLTEPDRQSGGPHAAGSVGLHAVSSPLVTLPPRHDSSGEAAALADHGCATRNQSYRLDSDSRNPSRGDPRVARSSLAIARPCGRWGLRDARRDSSSSSGRAIPPRHARHGRPPTRTVRGRSRADTTRTSRRRSWSTRTMRGRRACAAGAPPVRVPCQVDTKVFDEMRMMFGGQRPTLAARLVFHFKDCERMGLVDAASGDALIAPADRRRRSGTCAVDLVQAVRTRRLYVTRRAHRLRPQPEVPRRNLLSSTSRTARGGREGRMSVTRQETGRSRGGSSLPAPSSSRRPSVLLCGRRRSSFARRSSRASPTRRPVARPSSHSRRSPSRPGS